MKDLKLSESRCGLIDLLSQTGENKWRGRYKRRPFETKIFRPGMRARAPPTSQMRAVLIKAARKLRVRSPNGWDMDTKRSTDINVSNSSDTLRWFAREMGKIQNKITNRNSIIHRHRTSDVETARTRMTVHCHDIIHWCACWLYWPRKLISRSPIHSR